MTTKKAGIFDAFRGGPKALKATGEQQQAKPKPMQQASAGKLQAHNQKTSGPKAGTTRPKFRLVQEGGKSVIVKTVAPIRSNAAGLPRYTWTQNAGWQIAKR